MPITKVEIRGNNFIIEGELDPPKLSATGKTMVVASSGGFTPIPNSNGKKLNLTIIQPR